jgi:hypothetical protein
MCQYEYYARLALSLAQSFFGFTIAVVILCMMCGPCCCPSLYIHTSETGGQKEPSTKTNVVLPKKSEEIEYPTVVSGEEWGSVEHHQDFMKTEPPEETVSVVYQETWNRIVLEEAWESVVDQEESASVVHPREPEKSSIIPAKAKDDTIKQFKVEILIQWTIQGPAAFLYVRNTEKYRHAMGDVVKLDKFQTHIVGDTDGKIKVKIGPAVSGLCNVGVIEEGCPTKPFNIMIEIFEEDNTGDNTKIVVNVYFEQFMYYFSMNRTPYTSKSSIKTTFLFKKDDEITVIPSIGIRHYPHLVLSLSEDKDVIFGSRPRTLMDFRSKPSNCFSRLDQAMASGSSRSTLMKWKRS